MRLAGSKGSSVGVPLEITAERQAMSVKYALYCSGKPPLRVALRGRTLPWSEERAPDDWESLVRRLQFSKEAEDHSLLYGARACRSRLFYWLQIDFMRAIEEDPLWMMNPDLEMENRTHQGERMTSFCETIEDVPSWTPNSLMNGWSYYLSWASLASSFFLCKFLTHSVHHTRITK